MKKFLIFILAICLIVPTAFVVTGCNKKGEEANVTFWSQNAEYVIDSHGDKYIVLDCSIRGYEEEFGTLNYIINKFAIQTASAHYYVKDITWIKPENGFLVNNNRNRTIRIDQDVVDIWGRYYFIIKAEGENYEPLKSNSLAKIYYDGNQIGTFNYLF